MALRKNLIIVVAVMCLLVSIFCSKQPEEGGIIFSDEFTDSTLSQWSVFNPDNISVSDGILILRDACHVIAPSTASFQDYSVEIRSKITGQLHYWNGYAIMFRTKNEDSYYRFQYDPGASGLRLVSFPGDANIIPNVDIAVDTLWHNLKVKVFGDSIECFLDGDLMMAGTDDNYSNGAVGLCVWVGCDAEFDWIKVREIEWK